MDKKQFLNILKTVSQASEQKPTLPILSNLLIQTKEDITYITATDLEVELTYKLPEKLDLNLLTNASKLVKTINSCPKNEIELNLKNERLNIKSGSFKAKLPISKNLEEFPTLEAETKEIFKIENANAFADSLKKVSHATSKEEGRYALHGIQIKKEGNILKIVATDGHRLAYSPIEILEGEDIEAILPKKTVQILQKLITGYEPYITVETSEDKSYLLFKTDEWQFITRLIEGTFPNCEPILQEEGDKEITAPINPLLNAVKRVSSILDLPILILDINKDSLTITSKSETEVSETLQIKSDIQIQIGINGKYLIECLSQFYGAECLIKLSSPQDKLMFITMEEDNKYKELIMPVEV